MPDYNTPSAGGVHPKPKKATPKPKKKVVKTVTDVEATKQRVEVTPAGGAKVVDAKVGPLNFFDKIKSYYHTLIVLLAGVLVVLNQAATYAHWIPGYGTVLAGYISAAIVFLAAFVNLLKSNETWVQKL